MIKVFNRRFGIPKALQFVEGQSSLPKAILTHENGSSCETYLYGAHVTSYRTSEHEEILYMSSRADFSPGKAIRGGIPLIFPQFGPGALPSHGFARNRNWEIASTEKSPGGELKIVFQLQADEATKSIWPEAFLAEYEVGLSSQLKSSLRITNQGAKDFSFQCALHSYFTIGDIGSLTVKGLGNLDFLDNTKKKERSRETRSDISISSEIDRIYLDTPDELRLEDKKLGRSLRVRKQQFRDAVLWNPWIEKGASLKDLDPDAYQGFVCLETGAIEPSISLAPGETFEGRQELSAAKL